ncbi:hypothetical protein GW17_00034719 [Ensete ventricosum]|nr:hypothetical protein GW17_00034719 [Ensete ventricosum]
MKRKLLRVITKYYARPRRHSRHCARSELLVIDVSPIGAVQIRDEQPSSLLLQPCMQTGNCSTIWLKREHGEGDRPTGLRSHLSGEETEELSSVEDLGAVIPLPFGVAGSNCLIWELLQQRGGMECVDELNGSSRKAERDGREGTQRGHLELENATDREPTAAAAAAAILSLRMCRFIAD